MADVTKETSTGSLAWWLGGAVLLGLGYAIHRLLDFDIYTELDWDNLPA